MFKLKILNNHPLSKEIFSLKNHPEIVEKLLGDVIDFDRYPYHKMYLAFDGLEIYFGVSYDRHHSLINFDALSAIIPNTEITCQFRLWDTQIGESHFIDIKYTPLKGWHRYALEGFEAERDNVRYLGEEWLGYDKLEIDPVFALRSLIFSCELRPGEERLLDENLPFLNKLRLNPLYSSLRSSLREISAEEENWMDEHNYKIENPFHQRRELLEDLIFPSAQEKVAALGAEVLENKWTIASAFEVNHFYVSLSCSKYDQYLYQYYRENYERINSEALDEYILNYALNQEDKNFLNSLPSRFDKYEMLKLFK